MSDMLRYQAADMTLIVSRLIRAISPNDPATELPITQVKVCSILREGPRSMSAISKELGISLSAITQIADRMERAGLVERVPDCEDRRVRSLQLTSSGLGITKKRFEMRVVLAERILEQLPEQKRAEVIDSLKVLLDASADIAENVADSEVVAG